MHSPAHDPALVQAWKALQAQYAIHRNPAPFWNACQAIQDDLIDSHPAQCIDLCNPLATLAERLGVVDRAQLLAKPVE